MLGDEVNAEGGVEMLQITALSGSDGKVQALDLTRRTQQLLQQGLLLLLTRSIMVGVVVLSGGPTGCWFELSLFCL